MHPPKEVHLILERIISHLKMEEPRLQLPAPSNALLQHDIKISCKMRKSQLELHYNNQIKVKGRIEQAKQHIT
jgi:hypothetical protein